MNEEEDGVLGRLVTPAVIALLLLIAGLLYQIEDGLDDTRRPTEIRIYCDEANLVVCQDVTGEGP